MKRKFLLAVLVLGAVFSLAGAFVGQSVVAADDQGSQDQGAKDQASWQRDLLAWRAKRATGLQAPEGWLSLIALGWLKEGRCV